MKASRRRGGPALGFSGLFGRFQHPAQVVVGVFALTIGIGTLLLKTPMATSAPGSVDWLTALFTATSAVCVTGLVVVDTASTWSAFGEVVIALLFQAGGLGIMTLGTLFALLISGRLGLRARLLAQAERKALGAPNLRRVVRNVVLFTLTVEALAAIVLTVRFSAAYDHDFGRALYLGVFHSMSAFNNAGFALWPDSLTRFATDPWICLTIAMTVLTGALGFPVVFELWRQWRHPRRWSVLTRITVGVTVVLLVAGTLIFLITEWNNPRTMGPMSDSDKLLASFFLTVMRTGGFNTVDLSQLNPSSWLLSDLLMFIGGGSAGTAGGIKVTVLGLMVFMVWTEMRGYADVNIGPRQIPATAQRQAIAITLMGVSLVAVSAYLLVVISPHMLDQVLFEAISAFGTVGMSLGITAALPPAGHLLLIVLMFVGRTGPLTLGSALALRERDRRYELPKEYLIVG
ncbi:potassium uptake TrkH family protein [Thermocatellispora tengchongensis]|uniref:Potassium uptake TrkH family protein n=1 Tax=Thermocatellispora tengchongensis TaxID=1073253 RepID=A0A840P7U6_9ACTN|nr:potassium transporter TrkG [Thermocatellispora tengchongensis]MBB5137414.1 potassium uptake TrkH family protein [Thermocatellispora tengchongensis]